MANELARSEVTVRAHCFALALLSSFYRVFIIHKEVNTLEYYCDNR